MRTIGPGKFASNIINSPTASALNEKDNDKRIEKSTVRTWNTQNIRRHSMIVCLDELEKFTEEAIARILQLIRRGRNARLQWDEIKETNKLISVFATEYGCSLHKFKKGLASMEFLAAEDAVSQEKEKSSKYESLNDGGVTDSETELEETCLRDIMNIEKESSKSPSTVIDLQDFIEAI